ncbi:Hcp family type VI secretion system effector [Photobacterium chitinilyticum]|uniref:Type VI secretion system tube protein Hcp n=1 Tax=Photobacterium chitinilyticum TaxID=2485123 RepID=A0A3S3UM79_9GAMM|nr:type VI secretion system tube protein Hcp [Photobacterium chitinilyticum]RWX57240.1 type VI secretion system tube protein Hcp [Photobacterium chitinilyticum]
MQSNTYLDYNGIQGEATAAKFAGKITLLSVDWSIGREITSYTGTSHDREASAARLYDMTITKLQDKSSTLLFKEATIGQGVPAIFYITKQGKPGVEEIMKITLTDAMISNFSVSIQDDRPVETLTISYTAMEMLVTPSDDKNVLDQTQFVYKYNGQTGVGA